MLAAGQRVRVKLDWPETRGPCHIRTPHYLRGEQGTIMRHLGDYPNPEDLAFARPAALRPLYHVAFDQGAVWRDGPPENGGANKGGANKGGAGDELLVEIYEHWLEPI